MCVLPSCLVGVRGKVYAKDGLTSHTEIATACGVDEDRCLKYEFDLPTRTLRQDFKMDAVPFAAKQSHDVAAQAHFDSIVGTPARLMAYVRRGNWGDDVLDELLSEPAWRIYDKACAKAEDVADKAGSWDRTARNAAWDKAETACMKSWLALFRHPANRIPMWRTTKAPAA